MSLGKYISHFLCLCLKPRWARGGFCDHSTNEFSHFIDYESYRSPLLMASQMITAQLCVLCVRMSSPCFWTLAQGTSAVNSTQQQLNSHQASAAGAAPCFSSISLPSSLQRIGSPGLRVRTEKLFNNSPAMKYETIPGATAPAALTSWNIL